MRKYMLGQVAALLKPGATLLLVEPRGHVGKEKFSQELQLAAGCGPTVQRDIPCSSAAPWCWKNHSRLEIEISPGKITNHGLLYTQRCAIIYTSGV